MAIKANNPLRRTAKQTIDHGRKITIDINAPVFFDESYRYELDDWRFFGNADPEALRASYLVHEVVHHLKGIAASGRKGHYCSAGLDGTNDAYSYQVFFVAEYHMKSTPFHSIEPKIWGPPEDACGVHHASLKRRHPEDGFRSRAARKGGGTRRACLDGCFRGTLTPFSLSSIASRR